MTAIAAYAYAGIIVGVMLFQVCLIAGAPWGHLTQGGQQQGALTLAGRIGAGLSMVLLAAMACAVLSAAQLYPNWPMWTFWAALVLQVLSTLMNWATRSRPERHLWGPVTSVMLVLVVIVLLA